MSISPRLQRGRRGSRDINDLVSDLERLDTYTVATVPAAAEHTGKLIHVSNGAVGQPCLAYSNGTSWLRVLLGAAVSATV